MKLTIHIFIQLIFLSIILVGCNVVIQPHDHDELLLFTDDFQNEHLSWDTYLQPGLMSASYFHGGFVLAVESPNSEAISTYNRYFHDTEMQVFGRKIAGTDDNYYGVVCRYKDELNYYGFIITSDGYYGVFKVLDGDYHLLSSKNLEFSPIINQGNEINVIKAKCANHELSLMVNSNSLVEIEDDSLSHGKLGLTAGTYSIPEVAVKFDNVIVTFASP